MTSKTTSTTALTTEQHMAILADRGIVSRWNSPNHGLVGCKVWNQAEYQADIDKLAWEKVVDAMTTAWLEMDRGVKSQGVGISKDWWCKAVCSRINREEYLMTVVVRDDPSDRDSLADIWEAVDRLAEKEYGDVLLGRVGNRATYLFRLPKEQ